MKSGFGLSKWAKGHFQTNFQGKSGILQMKSDFGLSKLAKGRFQPNFQGKSGILPMKSGFGRMRAKKHLEMNFQKIFLILAKTERRQKMWILLKQENLKESRPWTRPTSFDFH